MVESQLVCFFNSPKILKKSCWRPSRVQPLHLLEGLLPAQLASVLQGYMSPSIINTSTEEVNLGDLDFPIIFKICIKPGFNLLALAEAGFDTTYGVYGYFSGQSRYNQSLIGWAGHTNTSGVQGGVTEVFERVRLHKKSDIFKDIKIKNRKKEWASVKNYVSMDQVNFQDNCYTLDLTKNTNVKETGMNKLFMEFYDLKEFTVDILVEGSSLACHREIKDHTFYFSGDSIKLVGKPLKRSFLVKIKQNIFVEEDPSKKCRDYPNIDFESYR